MQLDKLQLDLRPRTNAQALDLGLVLLRTHAAEVYKAWLALWLPLMALCSGLGWLFPEQAGIWLMVAWWLKPLLERAPLYILSREVFGESVTWKEAVRAWPRQLGGGWFRLLTWWRPFMPGRGLYQAIWQLEGARGAVAAERRKVIGRNNTARSAFWFGTMCAHFDMILQFGLLAFIGFFLSHENAVNPFGFLIGNGKPIPSVIMAATFAGFAFADAIIGPIYIACCFTLYLNRRATLEAWDIEIMLRQTVPPTAKKPAAAAAATATTATMLFVPFVLALALFQPSSADAAGAPQTPASCAAPKRIASRLQMQTLSRGPDQDAEQAKLRREVDDMLASEDLRGYVCEELWKAKNPADEEAPKPRTPDSLPDLTLLAGVIKMVLIAMAIGLVVWLLYRYRDKFPAFARQAAPKRATEIRGLDIRPESLPNDVTTEVRKLWERGQRRAALALLYRATLSRLVHEDGLLLTHGATEGDCLRLAKHANAERRLSEARLSVTGLTTELWMSAAYGDRWPGTDDVIASCAQWQMHFGEPAVSNRTPT